jgi:predicted tellurium resistance membrane protein TerC
LTLPSSTGIRTRRRAAKLLSGARFGCRSRSPLTGLFTGWLTAISIITRWRYENQEFFTGYLIELSLSVDNLFIFLLIFGYFKVPKQFQHRVLFWGIMGALLMRMIMIFAGAELVERFIGLSTFSACFCFTPESKCLRAAATTNSTSKTAASSN